MQFVFGIWFGIGIGYGFKFGFGFGIEIGYGFTVGLALSSLQFVILLALIFSSSSWKPFGK